VLLLNALWLAVLHALAVAAPLPLRGTGERLSHAIGAGVSDTRGGAAGSARSATVPAVGHWNPRSGDEGLRAPAPQPLQVVGRTSERRADALRPLHGLVVPARAWLRVLPGTGWRGATRDVSHAAAARGGHLPYFPTAPPLQADRARLTLPTAQ
jgi:hypothetical protein